MANGKPADQDPSSLASKRSEFVKTMGEVVSGVHDIAVAVGMTDPANALDHPDDFLEAVDLFLGHADLSNVHRRAWLKNRLAFFIGAWLARRYGGTWFLQENPKAKFYLKTVVGGFESDASLTVDPVALASRILSTDPPGSVRTEIANIGIDTDDTAPQVDIDSVTSRHVALIPKVRCTCGRSIWEYAGPRSGRVTWLTEPELESLGQELAGLLSGWLACSTPDQQRQFAADKLGLSPDESLEHARVAQELAAIAMSSVGRQAFECEGCGRVWLATSNDQFVPYVPEGDHRGVLLGAVARTISPPPADR